MSEMSVNGKPPTRGQRLLRLEVENFLKVKALDVELQGDHAIIRGRNGAGKTSILDAIWASLEGVCSRDLIEPIHEGADHARVVLRFPDYQVESTWAPTGKDGRVERSLVIRAADGTSIRRAPATLLKSFLGRFTLDPIGFLKLKPREQVESLLGILGVQPPVRAVEEITGRHHPPVTRREGSREVAESADEYLERLCGEKLGEYYQLRWQAGRELDARQKALADVQQQLRDLGGPPEEGDDSAPSELHEQLQDLREQDTRYQAAWRAVESARTKADALSGQIKSMDRRRQQHEQAARDHRLRADDFRRLAAEADAAAEAEEQAGRQVAVEMAQGQAAVQAAQDELRDAESTASSWQDPTDAITRVTRQLDDLQRQAEQLAKRRHVAEQVARLQSDVGTAMGEHEAYEAVLGQLRNLRDHLLDDIDLGVPGLGVCGGRLVLNGQPFEQASLAERIRLSFALACKEQPLFRCVRIDDAEHLDSRSKSVVFDLADQHGMQVIMTEVSDDSEPRVEIREATYDADVAVPKQLAPAAPAADKWDW